MAPFLAFSDVAAESRFSTYMGWSHRGVSGLLNVCMLVIWMLRVPYSVACLWRPECMVSTVLCWLIIAMRVSILYTGIANPQAYHCHERRRAWGWLLDLGSCMCIVLVHESRPPSGLYYPIFVFALHGWILPFEGGRLAADLWLHGINFMTFFILLAHEGILYGKNTLPTTRHTLSLLFTCGVLPLTVNLFYEAHLRRKFLLEHTPQAMALGEPFWTQIWYYTGANTQRQAAD